MNDFWMDDVLTVSVEVSKLVDEKLKKFDIVLTPEQEDRIHNKIWEVLEEVSNGNYRRDS
jgi:hypothetical protein